jgi:hypothetical protein
MADNTLTQLFALLADERHALLGARYDALAEIAVTKERCLQHLARTPPSKKGLQTLKSRLSENQRLIAAALRGVETARKRVEALEDVRDVLTTYDPFGKMTLTSKAQKTVEKKA